MEEKFKFSQFSTFERDGKQRNINELEDYLKESNKKEVSFKEKLKIGDEIKLKGTTYTVIVTNIKYEMPGIGIVDYAGRRKDKQNEKLLCLFNQKDIEKKIIEKDEEER